MSEIETLRQELAEARRQQTAIAEVLEAVAQTKYDRDDMLRRLLRTAAGLCGADIGGISLVEGEELAGVITLSGDPADEAFMRGFRVSLSDPTTLNVRSLLSGEPLQNPDAYGSPLLNNAGRDHFKFGAILSVPMMLDGSGVGVFNLCRSKPGAFSDPQIALVRSFAAQAVIAIANAKRMEELERKQAELSETLEQQTATAETLTTLSRSAFDLDAVLNTLVASAKSLCGANTAGLAVLIDGDYRMRATDGMPPDLEEKLRQRVFTPGRSSIIPRVLQSGSVEMIADSQNDPEFIYGGSDNPRSVLGVPLTRDGEIIGVFVLGKLTTGGFTGRQIELVKTYADQAVIAIGNVQLFKDLEARTAALNEALEQQTATAETLKTLSRSAFDLDAVFNTLVQSAMLLCNANAGGLVVREGEEFRMRAIRGHIPENAERLRNRRYFRGRSNIVPRVLLSGAVEMISDATADPEFEYPGPVVVNRSFLGVPLLHDQQIMGVFVLNKRETGGFTKRQIELVKTFADQAVIAIGNVNLFRDLEARTAELDQSLQDLRATQDRLIQSEKLASLGQLTAGVAHEIKNPLNFVNNFSKLSVELLEELGEALQPVALPEDVKSEVEDLTRTLTDNLSKIRHHGQRADSIVKNMLLHARQDGGERREIALNALIEESLNLAYHGARAERRDFNIELRRDLDPAVGKVMVHPQELTRVLLNLFSNGFYAAFARASEPGFKPCLRVSTKAHEEAVEVRVRDNGSGIPEAIREKLFTPFFTTKPAGEGTGLGLSLSYEIVVKQHGGSLTFETETGVFTEFLITLPRRAAMERQL